MFSRFRFSAGLVSLVMLLPAVAAAGLIDPKVEVRECSGGGACVFPPDWGIDVTTSSFAFELLADPLDGTIVGWTLDSMGNPQQHFLEVFNLGGVAWTSLELVFTNLQERVVGCPDTPGVQFPDCVVRITGDSNIMDFSGPGVAVGGYFVFAFGSTGDPDHFADGTMVSAFTNVPEPSTVTLLAAACVLFAATRYRRPPNSCSKALNSGRLRSDSRSGSMRA